MINFLKKILISKKRGFTLMEALVSIAIMSVIFASPLALAFNMYSKFDYLQKKMIANNLAQEGVEIVEIFRANAAILCIKNGDCDANNMSYFWTDSANGFVNNMLKQCQTECAIDYTAIHSGFTNTGDIDYSKFQSATNCNNMYVHDNGIYTCVTYPTITGEAKSGFARYIKVERYNDLASSPMSANTELLLTSGVTFYTNGELKRAEIKTILKTIN